MLLIDFWRTIDFQKANREASFLIPIVRIDIERSRSEADWLCGTVPSNKKVSRLYGTTEIVAVDDVAIKVVHGDMCVIADPA